jgi:HD-GYP domain-containing protein (c-di-GMP phosphodiesterase class II)
MGIVDVYDALVSKRPYKEPFSSAQAEEIIVRDSGKAFDPVLVEVFQNVVTSFDGIKQSLSGGNTFDLPPFVLLGSG